MDDRICVNVILDHARIDTFFHDYVGAISDQLGFNDANARVSTQGHDAKFYVHHHGDGYHYVSKPCDEGSYEYLSDYYLTSSHAFDGEYSVSEQSFVDF